MRYSRWLVPLLLLPLLVSVASVQAAPDPARTDRGRSVIYVDGNGKDIPNLLSSAEVEKLLTLTTSEVPMALLSPVSPDDQALLAVNGGALGFLSVQNGSLVPVDVAAFDRIFPLALDGVGGWAWRDGRTLVSLGVELVDPDNFIVQTVLVTLDRATGAVGAEVLPDVPIDDVPISLSPNGSRLLLLRSALVGGPSEELFSARITSPQRSFQPKSHLPARVQQQLSTFRSKSPVVRRLLNYRPWRDTEGDSVAVIREELSLLLYDTRTGETSTLKTLAPGTQFLNDAWSQDSARIALSFSGVFDYIEDLNTPRRPFDGALLSEQAYQDVTANLDPRRNPFFQDNTVETFDLGTGETHVLRAADGDGAALIGVSWSTDGTTLATLAADPARLVGRRFPIYTLQFAERTSVHFYSFDLKLQRRLERPELAGSVFSTDATFVSPDELILRAPLADNYHPYYYNLRSGEFRTIADRAGGYYQVRPTRLSRQLVFTFTSYTNPPDFYRMRWDGGGLSRLSWSNEGLAQFSKTKQYPVSFRLASGETRSGTLILPADVPFPPRNLSIVVWQEGGPGGTMDNAWNTIIERPFGLLPNFGFGVLSVPLAGREGLGPAGYKKLYNGGNFGQADIDEQAEIVRQMISKGWTSAGKVGITGCSYGGYFALQSAVRHPDLYRAANPQCAVVDWITDWTRGIDLLTPFLEGLPPYANPGEYRADSPLYNAGRIKASVLTIHGTNDFLPVTQNENMHLQLTSLGVPARMLVFVGEGHGLGGGDSFNDGETIFKHQTYAAQEMINWFRTSLR